MFVIIAWTYNFIISWANQNDAVSKSDFYLFTNCFLESTACMLLINSIECWLVGHDWSDGHVPCFFLYSLARITSNGCALMKDCAYSYRSFNESSLRDKNHFRSWLNIREFDNTNIYSLNPVPRWRLSRAGRGRCCPCCHLTSPEAAATCNTSLWHE